MGWAWVGEPHVPVTGLITVGLVKDISYYCVKIINCIHIVMCSYRISHMSHHFKSRKR